MSLLGWACPSPGDRSVSTSPSASVATIRTGRSLMYVLLLDCYRHQQGRALPAEDRPQQQTRTPLKPQGSCGSGRTLDKAPRYMPVRREEAGQGGFAKI